MLEVICIIDGALSTSFPTCAEQILLFVLVQENLETNRYDLDYTNVIVTTARSEYIYLYML